MKKTATQTVITRSKATAATQRVFGWILTGFFGVCVIAGGLQIKNTFDVTMVLFCALATGAGIALLRSGAKKKKLVKTFYEYSARLAADPIKSIDLLSSSLGITTDQATQNITAMIRKGFFSNAYIDTQRQCIVFTSGDASEQSAPPQAKGSGYVAVQCSGCGAINRIAAGTVGECEYCGSQIGAK